MVKQLHPLSLREKNLMEKLQRNHWCLTRSSVMTDRDSDNCILIFVQLNLVIYEAFSVGRASRDDDGAFVFNLDERTLQLAWLASFICC